MAINWHWAFGPETAADLQTDYGFTFPNTLGVGPESAAADVYSYTGSPTRYSMSLQSTREMTLPAAAAPSTSRGWIACAFKNRSTEGATQNSGTHLIRLTSTIVSNQIRVQAAGDQKSLSLYVDNTFKESTPPYDWDDWHYVALRFDFTTNPWSGQIYVDGVAATAIQTDARAADTCGAVVLEGCNLLGTDWMVGQVICYDDLLDLGYVPRFVTRVEPNADGTNIGTWTPSAGVDDYAVLDTPLDKTSYTANTVPASLNRVEVLTNGGGSDLDTALGTTTGTIDSVLVHSYSTGDSTTVRAKVGDGTASETAGANEVLNTGTISYAYAIANDKPSGGSWLGTDAPEFIFEVQ